MRIAAIVQANLVRTVRDRVALFFSVLLPLIMILVLGLTFGSQSSARVGVVDADGGPLATALVEAISTKADIPVEIRRYDTPAELRDAAARGFVELGIAIPAGYDAALRSGGTATIEYAAPPTQAASAVRATVEAAVAREAAIVGAARLAMAESGAPFEQALALARTAAGATDPVVVAVVPVGTATTRNGFGMGAQSQLILFMFLTALTGSVELVVSRQLGVSRRMFATSTGLWSIVAGEGVARVLIAVLQGVFIVVASALLFGVAWGDIGATAAIVLTFGLVAGAAALLVGSLARTPSQAGALAPALGLLFGLFGGTMVSSEVFPDTVRTLSRITPHAWAMDAFATLGAGGGVTAITADFGVLVGYALIIGTAAVLRLRHVLTTGG